eukprot:1024356-Pyramimonas_sp.AAC.3
MDVIGSFSGRSRSNRHIVSRLYLCDDMCIMCKEFLLASNVHVAVMYCIPTCRFCRNWQETKGLGPHRSAYRGSEAAATPRVLGLWFCLKAGLTCHSLVAIYTNKIIPQAVL